MLNFLSYVFIFLGTLWLSGAVYFDLGRKTKTGWALFFAVWIVSIGIVFLSESPPIAATLLAVLLGLFLLWWFRQTPSHDRNWDDNFARLPYLEFNSNHLLVHNLRHTRYPSKDQSRTVWEERRFDLGKLCAVDALIIFWGANWKCHPMAIFDFGTDGHLCFSIEVRYRQNEGFGILPSIYRQNELMYVVSDERDAILRRIIFLEEIDCYLYRLQADKLFVRSLLEEYVHATNRILEQPKWYHAIFSNCTTEIVRNRRERVPWDWRMLINGQFDKMLYDKGLLFSEIPFEQLKSQSHINGRAKLASHEKFSQEIRAALPGFPASN